MDWIWLEKVGNHEAYTAVLYCLRGFFWPDYLFGLLYDLAAVLNDIFQFWIYRQKL